MDTVLTIANRCFDIIRLDRINSLENDADNNARIAAAVLDRSGLNHVAQKNSVGESWSFFNIHAELETAKDQPVYVLPDGFVNAINDTFYSRSEGTLPLTLVTSPSEWAQIQQFASAPVGRYYYRIITQQSGDYHKAVELYPTPQDVEIIDYVYVTSHWLRESKAADASTIGRINSDANVPLISSYLVELDVTWRLRKELGLEYRADLGIYESERARFLALDSGNEAIPIGRHRSVPWYENPDWRVIE